MIWAMGLFLTGMFFSGFFSGSETGLYRVTKVRLALDGLTGDPIARGLLWIINKPTLFVATSLVGNNIANYMVSSAVVAGTHAALGGNLPLADLAVPVVIAPIVFVFGELLPKNLYYLAPNRLLRRAGPLFLFCGILFSPITAVLWVLGKLITRWIGQRPELVRMDLARNELQDLLNESREIGLLHPVQQRIAQSIFEFGSTPVARFMAPTSRFVVVENDQSAVQLQRLARSHRASDLLVRDTTSGELTGYVRAADVLLEKDHWPQRIRRLKSITPHVPHIEALINMQESHDLLVKVVDDQDKTVGIVSLERLITPIYR